MVLAPATVWLLEPLFVHAAFVQSGGGHGEKPGFTEEELALYGALGMTRRIPWVKAQSFTFQKLCDLSAVPELRTAEFELHKRCAL
jgi:hypothetical protein